MYFIMFLQIGNVENGGNYELWDESVNNHILVPSLFNRLVVMETNRNLGMRLIQFYVIRLDVVCSITFFLSNRLKVKSIFMVLHFH